MIKTRRRALISAAAILGVGLTSFALSIPASADVDADFVQSGNASDPAYFECVNPASPYNTGWCLVASKDRGEKPLRKGQLGENYYPMSETQVWFSSDGLKWGAVKTAVSEDKLTKPVTGSGGFAYLSGTKHLWAPFVRTLYTPGGRAERPAQNYFLYTPDILSETDRYSSRIWVTYSTNPLSGYGDTNVWGTSWKDVQIQGIPTSAEIDKFKSKYPLYMSDPAVFTNAPEADHSYWDHEFDDYLLWADGDAKSCGGLSLRKMTNQYTVQKFSDPNQAWLTINGLNSGTDALGKCAKTYPVEQTIERPYIEGGELYHSGWWSAAKTSEGLPGPYVLVFAAKPDHVPTRCATSYGEPNTSFEVIGYATANSVTGPYTYQGIIMCGSASEWTNQATIEQVKAPDGTQRLVLIYHDGPKAEDHNDTRNRGLHAECLYAVDGKFVKTMRSTDGAASVTGSPAWCISNSDIVALTSKSKSKYVTIKSSGAIATGADVSAWEQLSMVTSGSNVYFKARNGNKYLGTSTTAIKADQSSQTTAARFTLEKISGTLYRIKDSNGRYVQTASDGTVKANSTAPSSTDTSYQFYLQTLSN